MAGLPTPSFPRHLETARTNYEDTRNYFSSARAAARENAARAAAARESSDAQAQRQTLRLSSIGNRRGDRRLNIIQFYSTIVRLREALLQYEIYHADDYTTNEKIARIINNIDDLQLSYIRPASFITTVEHLAKGIIDSQDDARTASFIEELDIVLQE